MVRILLIDDSETVRTKLSNELKNEAYEVIESSDGMYALELIKSDNNFQLIICDINMPQMDGLVFCTQVRSIPELSEIPIIMLTTQATEPMKNKGRDLGVIAWVVKPYIKAPFLSAVKKILQKSSKNK